MNDTTRDELLERIAELADQFACGAAGEPVVYALHGPMDFAEEVIALVTAARDEEIREALLSEGTLNAKFPSMRVEVETKGGQMTAVSIDRHAFLSAALDHIGLHGDSDTGGQG